MVRALGSSVMVRALDGSLIQMPGNVRSVSQEGGPLGGEQEDVKHGTARVERNATRTSRQLLVLVTKSYKVVERRSKDV